MILKDSCIECLSYQEQNHLSHQLSLNNYETILCYILYVIICVLKRMDRVSICSIFCGSDQFLIKYFFHGLSWRSNKQNIYHFIDQKNLLMRFTQNTFDSQKPLSSTSGNAALRNSKNNLVTRGAQSGDVIRPTSDVINGAKC